MAIQISSQRESSAKKSSTQRKATRKRTRLQELLSEYFLVWLLLIALGTMLLPEALIITVNTTISTVLSVPNTVKNIGGDAFDTIGGAFDSVSSALDETARTVGGGGNDVVQQIDQTLSFGGASGQIAPLFTREIQHWNGDIQRWARTYSLDPNLLATVMQIESCGHPTVGSSAGAQGLFQVMPFHFSSTENQLDPDTNAMRGANFLNYCLTAANGDSGMAMACYNGGPSVLGRPFANWVSETQRYYQWGTGIYADALNGNAQSPTLDRWLTAGGGTLCDWASTELGIR
ncbi:MAG: transglycosylase SLT domain-containing protein [Aggregatilineales bacterium]